MGSEVGICWEGSRRIQVNGVRMMTAVAREAYSNDKLVVWRGNRKETDKITYQDSIETPSEFYERAALELRD